MAFNYEAALRAGYSPEDIIGHLTKTRKFNVEGALNAGYSPFDIIEHLSQDKPFATQMYEAGKRGVASTVNAAELFGAETPEEISSLVAENVKAQDRKSTRLNSSH